MTWLTYAVVFAIGIAVGMGIGFEQGYRTGKRQPLSEAEFAELTAHEHEWTDWWHAVQPDGTRIRVRGCLHCETYETEPLSG